MTVHHFEPDHYFTTFGPHPPVLRIMPGDTVVTTTVDARGFDAAGDQVAERGNPETGPFYVEGAEPGDTLAIHLDRVYPNRTTGWTANAVAPNVVDPAYVPELPKREIITWDLDLDNGTATLRERLGGLGELTLPLRPMLGCLGVAPAGRQAISTSTSGPHGGNMDYRGYVEGVTAYFPVFVPGGLIHLGDGHAVQGDGEIVGTGIETAFEVRFTVELLKGKLTRWPRGENDDPGAIFTAGNARPLDQAVQHATTEMLRWLQEDYGLSAPAASTLLGQVVEYDLGNIYDPAYTMVCKVPKHVLP